MASTNVLTAGLGGISAPTVANISRAFDNSKNDDGGQHFVYWLGEDGNVWVNQNGTTRNIGKAVMRNGEWNGNPEGSLLSMHSNGTRIDNPNPSGQGNASNAGAVNAGYDAVSAQLNAEKARRQGEAQTINNAMAGKRGQFADILNEILGNIDKTYEEEVGKLSETYDEDKAELIDTLADAIPEIGNSFASIGAYDSSQRAVRNAETREEEAKAEKELEREFTDNKANMGNKRNSARNEAQNAYDNFMIDFDTLEQTEATSDNLETLRQSQNSLLKGLSDFGSQRNIFKPGSTFANEMSSLNKYNGTKAKDALSNFLASAGASGMSANGNGVGSINTTKQNSSNKKQESELEVNQKTGIK